MKRTIGLIALLSMMMGAAGTGTAAQPAWREEFRQIAAKPVDGMKLPENWDTTGGKRGVPMTQFSVVKDPLLKHNVLQVKATRSTGGIIVAVPVDLQKTPILHWRWRVLSLPANGDGRDPKRDDQPVAIYIGAGGGFTKRSLAYRWETETPKNYAGNVSYGGGIVKVRYITLRDKNDKIGEWVTEKRNVAADYQAAYGEVPKKFALSILGNSQYTKSDTTAEVEFLEFLPEEAKR